MEKNVKWRWWKTYWLHFSFLKKNPYWAVLLHFKSTHFDSKKVLYPFFTQGGINFDSQKLKNKNSGQKQAEEFIFVIKKSKIYVRYLKKHQ